MDLKDIIGLGIASISLLVSIIALFIARNANTKAAFHAGQNLNIQYASIENQTRQSIEAATQRFVDLGVQIAPLEAKLQCNEITAVEKQTLENLKRNLKPLEQSLLNQYEGACANYTDGKIDKERFKKSYQLSIRQLVESTALAEYFHPTTSSYKVILKVYREWEDSEK